MKKFVLVLALVFVAFASASFAQGDKPLLLRQPTLSRTDIAFMYGDDLDWSKRFRQAGWNLIYFPGAESLHYGGASSSRAPIKFSVEMQRANFQYWQKHHGVASQVVYRAIVSLHQALRLVAYSALWLAAKSKQAETAFKAKRSLACMRWAMGVEDKRGEQVR